VNHTEWHRIVAFGKPADYAKNLKKGDYVEIEGELRSTEYDAEVGEGKKKTTVKRRGWEVRASIVKKLAKPQSSRGRRTPTPSPSRRTTRLRPRCPPSGGAIMTLFTNTLKFAASSAKMPRRLLRMESPKTLTRSCTWQRVRHVGPLHQRVDPNTDWHRIICPGPFFCGLVRGMRRGDYLEVEGELRSQDQPRTVVVAGESHSVAKSMPFMPSAFRGWIVPKHWSISARTANTFPFRGEADASPLFF
jgi:hypothetical protein